MTARGRRPLAGLGPLLLLALAAPLAWAADEVKPGAYCPLPEPGITPACLVPAKEAYGEFFRSVEEGDVGDAQAARVEADVAAGIGADHPYLALSSLAYGYYRLSERAAQRGGEDPAAAARLERWNALLAAAYRASPDDPGFQRAVREAALDIQHRAPPVRLTCVDAAGETHPCDSTEAVLRGLDAADGKVGIRGALERLLERIGGNGDS